MLLPWGDLFYNEVKNPTFTIHSVKYSASVNNSLNCVIIHSARQILVLPYVKDQMTDFILELTTLSEMREKESPTNKTAKGRSASNKALKTTNRSGK